MPLTVAGAGGGYVICTADCTVMVRVGGLGSLIPKLSTAVSDATEVPAVGNVTQPELSDVLVTGVAPGKYHEEANTEPSGSTALAPKFTIVPALMVMSAVGALVVPWGG